MAVFKTREVLFESEASFCVNTTTVGAGTKALPVTEATFEFTHERVQDATFQGRQNVRRPGYKGPNECRVTLTMPFYGHNTAATGALTGTVLYELLSEGLGGGNVSQIGGAVGDTTPSTTSVAANHTGTIVQGCVVLVGAKGDGRADAQAALVAAQGTGGGTDGDIETAMPGAPNDADVIYATQHVYPTEAPTVSQRFYLMHSATGAQYVAHGCELESLTLDSTIGQLPSVTLVYRGAYWQRTALTVPSTKPTQTSNVAPIAGGSLFMTTADDDGLSAATRAVITPSAMTLTLNMGLAPNVGPGGNFAHQYIQGWERLMCQPDLAITAPWGTDYETLWDSDGSNAVPKLFLATFNPTPGRAVGFVMQKATVEGPRPTIADNEGLLYQEVLFQGTERTATSGGTAVAGDLELAGVSLFMG